MRDKSIPAALRFERFPVDGPVTFKNTSFYDPRGSKRHNAIDTYGIRFSKVRLPCAMKILHIERVKPKVKGGNLIWACTVDDQFINLMSHLEHIVFFNFKKVGDWKNVIFPEGFLVGLLGDSGNAWTTRCHLHDQWWHAWCKPRWNGKKIVGRGRPINYAEELKRILKAEGRRKTPSRCKKYLLDCTWCT